LHPSHPELSTSASLNKCPLNGIVLLAASSLFLVHFCLTLKAELNPICYLLALLAHHFLHVSRIRVKSEAVGFLGQKNPQRAFLWRGSKAIGPMS
jgi:hypothetical protein